MARELPEIEQRKFAMLKTLRTAVRLSHALAADAELNKLLPAAEKEFDRAVQRGELPDPVTFSRAMLRG